MTAKWVQTIVATVVDKTQKLGSNTIRVGINEADGRVDVCRTLQEPFSNNETG